MKPKLEHHWDVNPRNAREIQEKLRERLRLTLLLKNVRYIAGADVSSNKHERAVYAGIIVLSFPELIPLEYEVVKTEVTFPYIPGFLSFREVPPLLQVWEKLKIKPDAIIVDGHGIAHPRRLGIASHFGLLVDIPTIGAAKKILYGRCSPPDGEAGSLALITDPKTGEVIGAALRSKTNTKPIYISPGNALTLEDAVKLLTVVCRGHRLPEPTRLAHELVSSFRRGELLKNDLRYNQTIIRHKLLL